MSYLLMMLPKAGRYVAIAAMLISSFRVSAQSESTHLSGSWRRGDNEEGGYVNSESQEEMSRARIGVGKPGSYSFSSRAPESEVLYDKLSFRLFTPGEATGGAEVIVHIKDVDFCWYQKLLSERTVAGQWTQFEVPLYNPPDMTGALRKLKYAWTPERHFRPFDRTVLRKMREVGFTLVVPAVEIQERKSSASEADLQPPFPEFIITDVMFHSGEVEQPDLEIGAIEYPETVPQYEKFEATFDLTRDYYNPFDSDVIDVTAHFVAPSGKEFSQPCFFFQDYQRDKTGPYETLTPIGPPVWKMRIGPFEKGNYTWWLTAKDKDSEFTTGRMTFTTTGPVSPGFIRVSKKDPLYFEFFDGSLFYPIGLNLHCTYDDRFHNVTLGKGLPDVRDHPGDTRSGDGGYIVDERSYMHTGIFEKMGRNGMNATEIWLASWGYEIEWRGDWKGFAGIGHYNMENAWRLDTVTDSARDNGVYFNLVFHCHGQFSRGGRRGEDGEFDNHPYNTRLGGMLSDSYEFFQRLDNESTPSARAFEQLMKRARYIVARYGYSRNIFSWEVISETDLTSARVSGSSRRFVLRYADRLKAMDIHHHPVTNHYSNNWTATDMALMGNDTMDFVTGDAYRGWAGHGQSFRFEPLDQHLIPTAERWNPLGKPGLITECGCCWFGGPEYCLRNDVHQLCWAGWMTHLAGTSLFWWFEFVDDNNLYTDYAAFAKYVEGEDKRARNLKTNRSEITASGSSNAELAIISLTNNEGGYAWIYDLKEYDVKTVGRVQEGIFNDPKTYDPVLMLGANAQISGFSDGSYEVEMWDTHKGKIMTTLKLSSWGGKLSIPLPPFKKDMALKIRKKTGR